MTQTHEIVGKDVVSLIHPLADWTIEPDHRIVPILPLVTNFYDTLCTGYDEQLARTRLKRIGDLLLPHAQHINQPVSIGDFIQIGTDANVTKRQYWDYEVKIPNSDGINTAFRITKTDSYGGNGTFLRIQMLKDTEQILEIILERMLGQAWLSAGRNKDDSHEMAFHKALWRKGGWKSIAPK
jgi:hypothetical protein